MTNNPVGNVETVEKAWWQAWRKMADESLARVGAFYEELDKIEAKNLERAETAIQEAAKLTKDTLVYGAQLGAEWRRLSLETLQRAAQAPAATDAAR